MGLKALIRDRRFLVGLVIRLALALTIAVSSSGSITFLVVALLALAADLAIFLLLSQTGYPERRAEVASLYWLSPLVIWLVYGALNFAVLSGVLLVAFFALADRRLYAWAGAAFGLACAIEPALVIVIAPILLVFAASVSRLRDGAAPLLAGATLGFAALALPASFSPLWRTATLSAFHDLFALNLPLAGWTGLALLPLALAAIVYLAWRARLIDREILWSFFTLATLATVAVAGPRVTGPMVILAILLSPHAAYAERSGRLSLYALSGLLLLRTVLFQQSQVCGGDGCAFFLLPADLEGPALAALSSAIAVVCLVVGVQVLQRGVLRSHTYLAARRPLAVGIAGDSGVGKDALSDSLAALFSPRTVTTVSGDDYHNWDRNKPMWRALTHLNPAANNLVLFNHHVSQLVDRRWVLARHYDHKTGRMTKPLRTRPGELVIASGLHALTSPALNSLYDLRIFLDMDERLRRFFKVRRDVTQRGHPLSRVLDSIERRQGDAAAYIHPQKATAHMVVRLESRRPDQLDPLEMRGPVAMRLAIEAAPGISFGQVTRALVAICDVYAVETPGVAGSSRLVVEGEPSPEDIAAAAHRLAPRARDLLRGEPGWQGGLAGVLQLVMLDQLEQIRDRRSINA